MKSRKMATLCLVVGGLLSFSGVAHANQCERVVPVVLAIDKNAGLVPDEASLPKWKALMQVLLDRAAEKYLEELGWCFDVTDVQKFDVPIGGLFWALERQVRRSEGEFLIGISRRLNFQGHHTEFLPGFIMNFDETELFLNWKEEGGYEPQFSHHVARIAHRTALSRGMWELSGESSCLMNPSQLGNGEPPVCETTTKVLRWASDFDVDIEPLVFPPNARRKFLRLYQESGASGSECNPLQSGLLGMVRRTFYVHGRRGYIPSIFEQARKFDSRCHQIDFTEGWFYSRVGQHDLARTRLMSFTNDRIVRSGDRFDLAMEADRLFEASRLLREMGFFRDAIDTAYVAANLHTNSPLYQRKHFESLVRIFWDWPQEMNADEWEEVFRRLERAIEVGKSLLDGKENDSKAEIDASFGLVDLYELRADLARKKGDLAIEVESYGLALKYFPDEDAIGGKLLTYRGVDVNYPPQLDLRRKKTRALWNLGRNEEAIAELAAIEREHPQLEWVSEELNHYRSGALRSVN